MVKPSLMMLLLDAKIYSPSSSEKLEPLLKCDLIADCDRPSFVFCAKITSSINVIKGTLIVCFRQRGKVPLNSSFNFTALADS